MENELMKKMIKKPSKYDDTVIEWDFEKYDKISNKEHQKVIDKIKEEIYTKTVLPTKLTNTTQTIPNPIQSLPNVDADIHDFISKSVDVSIAGYSYIDEKRGELVIELSPRVEISGIGQRTTVTYVTIDLKNLLHEMRKIDIEEKSNG